MHKISRIALAIVLSCNSMAFIKANDESSDDTNTSFQNSPELSNGISTDHQKKFNEGLQAQHEKEQESQRKTIEKLQRTHQKEAEKRKKRDIIYRAFKDNKQVTLSGLFASLKAPAKELSKAADYATYEEGDIQTGKIIRDASKEYVKAERTRREKVKEIITSTTDKTEILYQLMGLTGGEATNYLMSQPEAISLARQTAHYATYTKNDPEVGKVLEVIAHKLEIKDQSVRNERYANATFYTTNGVMVLMGAAAGWLIKSFCK